MANQELVNGALTRLGLGVRNEEPVQGQSRDGCSVVDWSSVRFGHRRGRVVLSDGSNWLLMISEEHNGLTWVQSDLTY
jgi:hypothetical protein